MRLQIMKYANYVVFPTDIRLEYSSPSRISTVIPIKDLTGFTHGGY